MSDVEDAIKGINRKTKLVTKHQKARDQLFEDVIWPYVAGDLDKMKEVLEQLEGSSYVSFRLRDMIYAKEHPESVKQGEQRLIDRMQ